MKASHSLSTLANGSTVLDWTIRAAWRDRVRGGKGVGWLLIFLLLPIATVSGETLALENLHTMKISHSPTGSGRLSSVAWDGQAWIVVGARSTILRSEDGREWHPQAANAEVCFRSLTSGGGTLLALTHCNTALLSRDGFRWQPQGTPGLQVRSAAFGGGVFVAVGESGTILISSNAATWNTVVAGSSASLLCVRYAGQQFVAAGAHGAVLSSSDGRQWSRQDSGSHSRLLGLAHGGGAWVAVGSHGEILSSPDGEHWTPRESGTEETLQAVAFGDGTFLAVGWKGCLLASSDGRSWRSLPSRGSNLYDVAYGHGQFVAVGERDAILLVGRNLPAHIPLASETRAIESDNIIEP